MKTRLQMDGARRVSTLTAFRDIASKEVWYIQFYFEFSFHLRYVVFCFVDNSC